MIGDFVTFGPSVTLAGNIRIGDDCIIGAGSTILPDLRIGAGAIVAAGSVVRRQRRRWQVCRRQSRDREAVRFREKLSQHSRWRVIAMDATRKKAASPRRPANSRAALNIIEARAAAGAVFVEWTDFELSYAALLDGIRRCCGVFDSRNLRPRRSRDDPVPTRTRRDHHISGGDARRPGAGDADARHAGDARQADCGADRGGACRHRPGATASEEDWLKSYSTIGVADREGGISNLFGRFRRAEKGARRSIG